MIEQFLSISDKIDDQLQRISCAHPQWRIVVTKEYKVYNGDSPPVGWEDDYLPHIMIHGPGWRAWLAPCGHSNVDDYILPEYNNCIHLHKNVKFSKPLEDLLETEDGRREIIRSDKDDRVCYLDEKIDPFNQLDLIVDLLEKLPTEKAIDHILWRIREIDNSIRDIDYMIAQRPNDETRRKNALTLMFVVADSMAKIPCNITKVSLSVEQAVSTDSHVHTNNSCISILDKHYPKQRAQLHAMRNELCHDALWYPDAMITPSNDSEFVKFWMNIKSHWHKQKTYFNQL